MASKKNIYYSDYLELQALLNSQNMESEKHGQTAHDEMLFIVTHQTFELWFKQFLYELDAILKLFNEDHLQDENMNIVVNLLRRLVKIQRLLIQQFDVLDTMSAMDFLSFRDFLIPASGFQSFQFKLIEKKLGITLGKPETNYSLSVLSKKDQEKLTCSETSLFSGVEHWLERNPFLHWNGYSFEEAYEDAISHYLDQEIVVIQNHPLLDKDRTEDEIKKVESFKSNVQTLFHDEKYTTEKTEGRKKFSRKAFLSALFIRFYKHYAILQMPYRILDLLIDVNDLHMRWKQRHLIMIQRMIGMKMGTGGTSGKSFLENTIRQSNIFSDLVEIPSYMIPKKYIPQLPEQVSRNLGYTWK